MQVLNPLYVCCGVMFSTSFHYCLFLLPPLRTCQGMPLFASPLVWTWLLQPRQVAVLVAC